MVLYSGDRCGYCRQAKGFLQRSKVPFSEYNVARNRRAMSEFQRLGGRAVPLIMVGDQRLDGFDPKRLGQLLRTAGFDV